MTVEFYDVKTRKKVKVSGSIIKSKFVTGDGQTRYGIRGKTEDGRVFTKFVSKSDWDKLDYPSEK
jgi:hypothetical protein